MKLADIEVKQYTQEPGLHGMFKAMQDAAWICYQTKSSKLTPEEFAENILLKKGHLRPLEFGTVYLAIPYGNKTAQYIKFFKNNKYSRCTDSWADSLLYVTTTYRVIMEGTSPSAKKAVSSGYANSLKDVLKYWTEPTQYHIQRPMFFITATRSVCDEFKTHTTISSLMESTRFCNYSAGRFNSEITFIRPYVPPGNGTDSERQQLVKLYEKAFKQSEINYFNLIGNGVLPQHAREVLLLGVKSQIVMCGFPEHWDNFFYRRIHKDAQPEAKLIESKIGRASCRERV